MGTEIALIFGSVDYGCWDFLQRYRGKVHTICADGGIQLARRAGFRPEAYVGDGDSGGSGFGNIAAVLLPEEKDVTDLEAAFEFAKTAGYQDVIFTACTGGRQDHHLANLQLLQRAAQEGIRARIVDPDNEIRYLDSQSVKLRNPDFAYFSLIPIDAQLEGVTISGAKYPLENATVCRGSSLTVSNACTEAITRITVGEGACWLVLSQRKISN